MKPLSPSPAPSSRRCTRRELLEYFAASGLVLAAPACAALPLRRSGKRPNFLFILVDDLGRMDLGCFGSTFYDTPNLDRLAGEGMRFTDAYAACPVCSPTRASILAGKYPARMKTTDWFGGRNRRRLNPAPYLDCMPLEEVTLAEALRAAGYATFFAGKWHLGDTPFTPEHQGFDENVGGWRMGHPRSYFSPYRNPKLPDGIPGEHLADRLVDASIRFLEGTRGRPFLLYLSFYSVHTPLQAKPVLTDKYRVKAEHLPPPEGPKFLPEHERKARQVQDHPVYAGMVQAMDENVGRVLHALERLGLAEDTVVIFMSDNGGLSTSEGSPTSNVPFRAGKGWLYEGGIREPMIIQWPGVTRPGSTCSVPVISTDFYPTILEMADLPLRPEQHKDGVSLVPLLRGGNTLPRKALYWHYPHYSNQGGTPTGAVRAGKWKLIEFFEDGHVELYDLARDLPEAHDLSAAFPDKAAELRRLLHAWREEVGALMPAPNPDWKGR